MAEDKDQEGTEPATEKKRSDARKKGQIAHSREIPSVLVLLSSLSVFYFAGAWMVSQVSDVMRTALRQIGTWTPVVEDTHAMFWMLGQKAFILMAPLLVIVIVAGLIGNVSQTGFLLVEEALVPKLSKLNPWTGLKRIFSVRGLVELVKSVFKMIIIAGVFYLVFQGEMEQIPALVHQDIQIVMSFLGRVALKIGFITCLVLIVPAALDFYFQQWKHERDLRMTKQEVKDELKQREGDPIVRSRIRAAQREMAMRRMMQAIPGATVVITNPTHFAVAIKFGPGMPAPKVVAKGGNWIARHIREFAERNNVPLVEKETLARALFKHVEIGQHVPAELYQAVAEVLAYVYRLKGMVQA